MKKRMTSLLLVLAMCFAMLPTTAFAAEEQGTKETQGEQETQGSEPNAEPNDEQPEEPSEEPIRTSITTVEDLMKFAEEAQNGRYDGKTDSVVSLDADLDLTGKTWVPIAGRPIGNEVPCFSGTFYGNNHVISGLDLSSAYNEQQNFAGFFGALWKAKVYDLTVKGSFDATESDGSFRGSLGSIAGFADSSVISNCVSEVSFNNNGKILAGMIGMVGEVHNTLVEYCENKGEFTFTNDMGSSYIGGIVGCADDNSEIKYCANTAPMTLLATNSGAIAGAITGQSKIDNCYATGKLTVLGTASQNNVSGMVGTIYTGTTISNSYFAGEFDLSKYGVQLTPEKPAYMRLGGIAGQIGKSSDTELAEPQFANDYYTKTENIFACGRDTEARAGVSTKSADYMKTEDFYKEITEAGGAYRYEEGRTPLLPKLTHEVSFVITPENMTDIVVTVDGQEAANPIALENGKHTFTVTAKNCDPFSGEFTVSANPETHTQTVAMTYRRPSSSSSSKPSYSVTAPGTTENGSVTVSPKNATKGSTVTVTVKPDDGYQLDKLIVTDVKGGTISVTDKGNGKYTFTMPASKVTVTPTFVKIAQQPTEKTFVDVAKSDWFADAAAYVTEKGLMNGTGSDTFSPNASTTRGMLMTVLARYAGTDTTGGSPWYQKGMNWAKANGVSDGTNPTVNITREQLVTMLYRYAGSPAANGSLDSFSDAASVSSYAVNAMQWAVANGIVNGSNGKLNPQNNATRAEVAAILMRFCEMGK